MDIEQKSKIINMCDPGWRVLAVAVPTHGLRLIANELNLVFRVEQLNPGKDKYKWAVVSTHAGTVAWESYLPALRDMLGKQTRLKEMIKLAQHEKKMATIRAERPHV